MYVKRVKIIRLYVYILTGDKFKNDVILKPIKSYFFTNTITVTILELLKYSDIYKYIVYMGFIYMCTKNWNWKKDSDWYSCCEKGHKQYIFRCI